jgi:hypothetical protein
VVVRVEERKSNLHPTKRAFYGPEPICSFNHEFAAKFIKPIVGKDAEIYTPLSSLSYNVESI